MENLLHVVNRALLKTEGKSDNLPSSFRRLCMLDSMGKLLELLLHKRLVEEIQLKDGLMKNQFGFRAENSTIGAMQEVGGSHCRRNAQ